MNFTILAKANRKYLMPALLAFSMIAASVPAEAAKHRRAPHAAHHRQAYSPTYAGFVMDAASGQILYQNNADQALHPASLTKIMTLLMVFEALDKGELGLNDRIAISNHAASMEPSKLGLDPGSSISVKDGIYAVVTKSCNDIAVAFAEHLSGSEGSFAQRMTARARDLGMTHTSFANASGLPNPNQWSSARDMARLARYVIANYPAYYRFYSTKNYYYQGELLHNHNNLMSSYAGMDGMKTGYIGASGFNLVASAVRDNHRLIGVVFGGKTANSRNDQMASLLDASFEKLRNQRTLPVAVMASNDQPTPAAPSARLNAIAPAATQAAGEEDSPQTHEARATVQAAPALPAAPQLQLASVAPILTQPAAPAPEAAQDEASSSPTLPAEQVSLTRASLPSWAIQIGAFSSRAATSKAVANVRKKLPVKFASVAPVIAPTKKRGHVFYHARLHGFSKKEALRACRSIRHCVPVAPAKAE